MMSDAQPVTVDAFLWDRPGAPAQPQQGQGVVIDVTPVPANEYLVPVGMFNQWPLEVLFQITKPFTGLVVLIDVLRIHRRGARDESLLQSVTACVAGLLRENEFGCRTTADEFVMVCPGLEGTEAQRRLNQISEQLWEFHQRGSGVGSLVFSWGGIGTREKPLSDAIAAAVERMNRINRNRVSNSKESVKHHRKVV